MLCCTVVRLIVHLPVVMLLVMLWIFTKQPVFTAILTSPFYTNTLVYKQKDDLRPLVGEKPTTLTSSLEDMILGLLQNNKHTAL